MSNAKVKSINLIFYQELRSKQIQKDDIYCIHIDKYGAVYGPP